MQHIARCIATTRVVDAKTLTEAQLTDKGRCFVVVTAAQFKLWASNHHVKLDKHILASNVKSNKGAATIQT